MVYMRLNVLLSLGLASSGLWAGASAQDEPAKYTLTKAEFDSILFSEANKEFGPSEELYDAASAYEWSRAFEAEASQEANLRGSSSGGSSMDGHFPYIVCDKEEGKHGEDCRATVQSWFGDHVMVSKCKDLPATSITTSHLAYFLGHECTACLQPV